MANKTQIDSKNNNQFNSIVEETKQEDQLSSFPDEILLHILSHLSIFSAAKTAFFSRRWRHLWKGLTTVKLDVSAMNFDRITKLLNLLTSPNNFAENCIVEVLKLRSTSISCESDYLPVPNCVFNCESLVVLELDGILDWRLELDEFNDLPVDGTSINLPNLNKLLLRINGDDYCLLRTLVKFCPNLEDLSVLLELSDEEELKLDIIAPNIKCLHIEVAVPSSYSVVAIDAPKLVKLKIHDPCSYYTFETIPTSLVEASIKLKQIKGTDWFPGADESIDWTVEGHALALSEIVRDISSVRCLQVECYANMHSFFGAQYYGDMAVFPDLTFFRTTIDSLVGWDDLLRSLHCFPNLEHLELKIGDFYSLWPRKINDFYGLWPRDRRAPIVLPDCLLTKVKRITVKKAKRISDEIKLLEFILSYAGVLEELRIYGPSTGLFVEYGLPQLELLWREYNFCQALFKLPRSSAACEIVLSGLCINASSKAFENDLIGCQIDFEKLSYSDSEYAVFDYN